MSCNYGAGDAHRFATVRGLSSPCSRGNTVSSLCVLARPPKQRPPVSGGTPCRRPFRSLAHTGEDREQEVELLRFVLLGTMVPFETSCPTCRFR